MPTRRGEAERADLVRKGDFLVPKSALEEAEEAFEERSPRSRSLDRAFRAPITEDVDRWKSNQRGLDYPGVDTPRDDPRETPTDFPLPDERARFGTGRQKGVRASVDPGRDPPGLDEQVKFPDESVKNLEEALGDLW